MSDVTRILADIEQGNAQATDELLPVRFAALEPQQAELVKLRYFVGLKVEAAAEILGISKATATRWWAYPRPWLFHEISPPPG